MDGEQIAYVAGLVDGEGCIYAHRQPGTLADGTHVEYIYPAFSISMTERAPIELVRQLADTGQTIEWDSPERSAQTLYRLNLRSENIRRLMNLVLPHLVVKRQQARIALRMIDLDSQSEESQECAEKISKLNH